MKKTFKKIAASVMAAATLAVGSVGMTASAYSPTISKTVSGVKGTLYSETSYGYATTSCSGTRCYVKLNHGGVTLSWVYDNDYVNMRNTTNNGSTTAKSYHKSTNVSEFTISY